MSPTGGKASQGWWASHPGDEMRALARHLDKQVDVRKQHAWRNKQIVVALGDQGLGLL